MSGTDRALPDPVAEPTITAERAAAIFGVSRTAVYDAIGRGDISSVRVGRRVSIPTRRFLQMFFPEALETPTESDDPTERPAVTSGNGAGSHTISQLRGGGTASTEAA